MSDWNSFIVVRVCMLLLIALPSMAQQGVPCTEIEKHADKKPKYTGSNSELKSFFSSKLNFSPIDLESDQTVTVRFVVNCQGVAFDHQILSRWDQKQADPMLSDQVLNLSKEVDKWQAAIKGGKPVDAYGYLSIRVKKGKVSIL